MVNYISNILFDNNYSEFKRWGVITDLNKIFILAYWKEIWETWGEKLEKNLLLRQKTAKNGGIEGKT